MRADISADMLRKMKELERSGKVLSTAQKILLAETGTVEQMLSVLKGAPISVRVTSQSEKKRIIKRKVMLTSELGEPLVRAHSTIYCNNLPPAVVEKIRCKNAGIGTIIFAAGLETFRKITRMGVNKEGVPYRTYKISYRGKVAFEIREEILFGENSNSF